MQLIIMSEPVARVW